MCPATSVPYFSSLCGIVETSFNKKKFDAFLKTGNTSVLHPRDYIELRHKLEHAVDNLVYIIENEFKQ